jgi:hypothetical protein
MGQHKMHAEDAKEVMRVAYAEGLKDGAAKARASERAAVVAWLRAMRVDEEVSEDIEAGEHLPKSEASDG